MCFCGTSHHCRTTEAEIHLLLVRDHFVTSVSSSVCLSVCGIYLLLTPHAFLEIYHASCLQNVEKAKTAAESSLKSAEQKLSETEQQKTSVQKELEVNTAV